MTATTTPPQAQASIRARMQTFITDEVISVEADVIRNNLRETDDMRLDLQEKSRAAEVFGAGTPDQKERYLAPLASGKVLPTQWIETGELATPGPVE